YSWLAKQGRCCVGMLTIDCSAKWPIGKAFFARKSSAGRSSRRTPRWINPDAQAPPTQSLTSHRLAHAPEERQRPLGDAGEAAAPSVVAQVPGERRIDHVVVEGLVDPGRGGLLPVLGRRVEPGADVRLHRRAVGPSVHRRGAAGP